MSPCALLLFIYPLCLNAQKQIFCIISHTVDFSRCFGSTFPSSIRYWSSRTLNGAPLPSTSKCGHQLGSNDASVIIVVTPQRKIAGDSDLLSEEPAKRSAAAEEQQDRFVVWRCLNGGWRS